MFARVPYINKSINAYNEGMGMALWSDRLVKISAVLFFFLIKVQLHTMLH